MAARHDPGLVRDARSVGAESHVVSSRFHDTQVLTFFLRQNVAEDAALFALEVFASGAKFVEDAAWHKNGCRQLGSGVVEFLPGCLAVILENADVLESAVALQILNPQRGQAQELFDFDVGGIPDMAVVAGIFQQNFVSAHRSHAVIESVAAARRLAFDVVQGLWMDQRARRPRAAIHAGQVGDDMGWVGGSTTKGAHFGARREFADVVAGDHPGTGDGIFAQFHGSKKNKIICNLQLVICNLKSFCGRSSIELQIRRLQITNQKFPMSEPTTPLMRQYSAIKKEHPNALLFFRLGDFYELFFDDAVLAARELQITLTSRNKEKGMAIPMCGVPYHAAEGYISKLIRRGFKVAVCEQVEDARLATKLVRREVTRVVTPGTAADSSLNAEENNFLAAVATVGDHVGFAALDLSTGEFRATEFAGESAGHRIQEELEQLRPKEMLYGSLAPLLERSAGGLVGSFAAPDGRIARPHTNTGTAPLARVSGSGWAETPLDDWIFAPDHVIPLLENHFGVLSLEGFGLAGKPAAASAAGAILYYVRSTQRGTLQHVDRIGFYERQNCLVLDTVTVRNLELIEPLFAGTDAGVTLFRGLDATVTPMGKRLLRAWMLRPSIDQPEIEARLDAVEAQVRDVMRREELRRSLEGVLDLERLLSRVTLETANPRDVLALAASLGKLPAARAALAHFAADRSKALHSSVDELADLRRRIETTIIPEPPISLSDGGVIQAGVEPELDQLRDLSRNSKQFLAEIEQRERQRTGIASLKVKFNSIFGYYLEVSKANLHLAPPDYERKQTLVNAERFTTPELKIGRASCRER